MKKIIYVFTFVIFSSCNGAAETKTYGENPDISSASTEKPHQMAIKSGADQTEKYLPLLKEKKVGVIANHTSIIGQTHLVDSLISMGVQVVKVFSPEHGFRGNADAGAHIEDGVDSKTGLPIVSLYGKNRKPSDDMMQGIDIMVFDIQDVGVRFYTYISTMHYTMEASAENNIPYIVLDRPNPNGMFVDGPVLTNPDLKSFVGMHPIPIVHGLTVGELAEMINGEKWLKDGIQSNLTVIPVLNYDHSMSYSLPVKPSPNLPNDQSIKLYPSICLFEGTVISVGRGTYDAFQLIGHPELKNNYEFAFTPESIEGMASSPKYQNQECFGIDLRNNTTVKGFSLHYLITFYKQFPRKNEFFNSYFPKLAGTNELQKQIEAGISEEDIRKSWEPDLNSFKELRKKYLIY